MTRAVMFHRSMSPDSLLTKDQLAALWFHLEQSDSNIPLFCKFMGIEAVEDMTIGQYEKAMAAINRKIAKENAA
ncbi:hypothetical protein [Cohaesibacter celericrescens]|uniref:hypothetical protein n=1 Tax=Cohaesibacter celericrescens TaxID=2067669 RepID=UPI003569E59F